VTWNNAVQRTGIRTCETLRRGDLCHFYIKSIFECGSVRWRADMPEAA